MQFLTINLCFMANPLHPTPQTRFRYLPVNVSMQRWGFYVFNVGYSRIPPGCVYPPAAHPQDHRLSWQHGRTLHSPALVYITRGGGVFESRSCGRIEVRAGDLMTLFPGEWHRYRPDPATGWDEYWIEFDGVCARRFLKRKEFTPGSPVLNVGVDDAVVQLFSEMVEMAFQEQYGLEYLLSAAAMRILALVLAACGGRKYQGNDTERIINRAKEQLLKDVTCNVDLPALASDLSVSYTWLRRMFRDYTGFSPRQFQLHHRLRKASLALANTQMPVGQIAAESGFESVYYFSQFFKKKMGLSPAAFRKSARLPLGS